jgi:hypothetical protein
MIASGMPRIVVWPMASSSARPRQMLRVASVIMKGCENEAADDCRQRQVGANREIDAAGQNDKVLADRDNRDHRRLGEDVAKVAGFQKIGRQNADDCSQNEENEHGADAEEPQAEGNSGCTRRTAFDIRRSNLGLLIHRVVTPARSVNYVPYRKKPHL